MAEETEHSMRKSSKSSKEDDDSERHIAATEEHQSHRIDDNEENEIEAHVDDSKRKSIEAEESSPKHCEASKPKDPIEATKHRNEKPVKRKISFKLLFSCGTAKKSIKINLNEAIKSFNSHMTNFNGFTDAILCNSITAEAYATLPAEFNISKANTLKREIDEIFVVNGQEYEYTHEESKNTIFGRLKSDKCMIIGIKYNKRLMLMATWSDGIDKAKDQFLTCYREIVKGNEDV